MANQIRIGIIGCGQVSRVGHGPAIVSDERARITAVADPDDGNRAEFQRKFRVPAAYPDHRAMLEKEALDAVVIFTLSNDAVAVMEKSQLVMGRPAGFETGAIYAEKAKIAFEAFQEYQHKKMKLRLYTPRNILSDRYRRLRLPGGKKSTLYYRQMRHFIDRIAGERTVIADHDGEWSASIDDAATAVAWTLAGYRSAKEGREIGRSEILGETGGGNEPARQS